MGCVKAVQPVMAGALIKAAPSSNIFRQRRARRSLTFAESFFVTMFIIREFMASSLVYSATAEQLLGRSFMFITIKSNWIYFDRTHLQPIALLRAT